MKNQIMRFSQRIGKTPIKTILQIEGIDNDLKNRLWNAILEDFFDKIDSWGFFQQLDKTKIFRYIWTGFFKQIIDTQPGEFGITTYFKDWYFNKAEWYEIYDSIEFFANIEKQVMGRFNQKLVFKEHCNYVLEKELSGYRIIDGNIAKITDEQEIQAIEDAITDTNQLKSVNTHLKTALDYFTDKKAPDYRNSIKESISAVEALCKIILNNDKITLGEALNELEKKYQLHSALKKSFSALYGYTSDSGGIRHGLKENDVLISFDDAKFMLVSCSAFINYLKAKIKME